MRKIGCKRVVDDEMGGERESSVVVLRRGSRPLRAEGKSRRAALTLDSHSLQLRARAGDVLSLGEANPNVDASRITSFAIL